MAWPRNRQRRLKAQLEELQFAQALKSVGSAPGHTPAIWGAIFKGLIFLPDPAVREVPRESSSSLCNLTFTVVRTWSGILLLFLYTHTTATWDRGWIFTGFYTSARSGSKFIAHVLFVFLFRHKMFTMSFFFLSKTKTSIFRFSCSVGILQ